MNDTDKLVGTDTIMARLSVPAGVAIPKARVVSSTTAARGGASLDDIVTHGHWQSQKTFTKFYRLSSAI
ncbi:hypothetical protein BGZ76_007106 [Entomortierella beljakovae]|nr:hypothetical protein BGZ76_007106 [Entomortierella beljakovae]